MTELSTNQKSFIRMMIDDEEYERRGYELLLRRPDFDNFFDALTDAGLFEASRNLGPVQADRPGYYWLPYWNALQYLESVAKRAGEKPDMALAAKIMNVIRQVSRWRDDYGNIRSNENTWHSFVTIFGLVPTPAVSLDDIDLMAGWFEGGIDRSRIGAAFARGVLQRFIRSEHAEDWSKACRILYHCTAIRWVERDQIGGGVTKDAQTVVDDYWLKVLINSCAAAIGAKVGQEVAEVFLPRLREVFTETCEGHYTDLLRPAVEDHSQNHEWGGPPNRFVEGLRNVLLSWVDHDSTSATPMLEELLRDKAEIVRRIAIYIVNERFEALRPLVPLLFTQDIFDRGHLHELYGLLKAHFTQFTVEEKMAAMATIRDLALEEKRADPEKARRYEQRQWLSAIEGQGYDPADSWFKELMSDGTLGGLFPHPEFRRYGESRWGFGPAAHTVPELVSFAEAGTVVDKLNAFVPSDAWNGSTTRGLSDAIIDAVDFAPQTFLDCLPSFLNAKRPYQYAVIAGFKKRWDAWDGNQAGFDWNEAWPKLVEFFDKIIGHQAFWSEVVIEIESLTPDRNWIPPVISDFLRAGTCNDEKAYKPDLLPKTWPLIKILLKESEAQQGATESDALNTAINTPKGRAIQALFDHALRQCRVNDAEIESHANAWRDMQPVFDEQIAVCQNNNYEFSALAGAYIANLFFLDTSWTKDNFRKIFPTKFPANCLSALDGLYVAPVSDAIYGELVDNGILEWALNQETKGAHMRENLIQRMCVAYLWGKEELDSQRFALLFDPHLTNDLEVASRYFWMLRDEPLSEDQEEQIRLFWDRCVKWAQTVAPLPAKLLSSLSLLSCYLTSIGTREHEWLLAVAPHVGINYNADFFFEQLVRLLEASPLVVGKVLVAALQTHQPSLDFEDRLKKLVTKLAEHPETRPDAIWCANSLRSIPGMLQIYAQISKLD